MKVYEVVEYNTSKYCAYHNVEVKRYPRGWSVALRDVSFIQI